jgi:hypothetical protein
MDNNFQTVKQFQQLFRGIDFEHLRRVLGPSYRGCLIFYKKIVFVAKKLSCPDSRRTRQFYSKCFRLLTEFKLPGDDLSAELFQQSLEHFDPEILRLFLQIVAGVMHHPGFLACVEGSRRRFREGVLVLNPDRIRVTIYMSLRVIDSLAGMVVRPTLIG